MTSGGLPHSGTRGSTPADGSPRLVAAFRALHRPSTPRHPPCARPSSAHRARARRRADRIDSRPPLCTCQRPETLASLVRTIRPTANASHESPPIPAHKKTARASGPLRAHARPTLPQLSRSTTHRSARISVLPSATSPRHPDSVSTAEASGQGRCHFGLVAPAVPPSPKRPDVAEPLSRPVPAAPD
jgi:hypothetical protein